MVQDSELTVSIMSHDSGAEEVLLCKNAKEKVVVRYVDNNNNNKPKSAILDSGAEISITSNAAILQCYKNCNGTFVSEAELIPLGVNFRRMGEIPCLFF
ncbi:unnamed protein product [Ambrosiozyma monospora]|uniref:Unnamed protein product n=1 Tax=Ambrosiozyma monospora TaxID=43982 RepID=A0A9W6Z645_AMBMO|nr:unnamed protein product [Ambrosiozyma monospora]